MVTTTKMIDPEKTNDYFVRLGGKANIPEPLEIGRNYKLTVQGTVTSLTESDKQDGSHVIYYKFEPILMELIDDMGESIKAKDTRSYSQLFRARMWKFWNASPNDMSFEDWYAKLMSHLIQQADEIAEMYAN